MPFENESSVVTYCQADCDDETKRGADDFAMTWILVATSCQYKFCICDGASVRSALKANDGKRYAVTHVDENVGQVMELLKDCTWLGRRSVVV